MKSSSIPTSFCAPSRYWFTLLLMAVYVAIFLAWKNFPSRSSFLVAGLVAVAMLSWAIVVAARTGYFANWTDFVLHGLVILDIALETLAFEALLQFIRWTGIASISPTDMSEFISNFHANNNFYYCAAVFLVILCANRAWALRRQSANLTQQTI